MLDLDDFEENEFDEEEIRIRQEQKRREEQLAAEKKRLLASYSNATPEMHISTDAKKANTKGEPKEHNYRWIIIVVAIIGAALLGLFLAEYGGKILMGICVIIWLVAEFLIYPFKRK